VSSNVVMLPGTELLEPEGYMQPRKVRVSFQCGDCGHEWSRVYKTVPAKDPPCPNKACSDASQLAQLRHENENLRRMLEEGRPPAQIGKNPTVKAVDTTAEIVMQDYGMTDLRDNIRQGESVAPKLPPAQQKAADTYFAPEAGRSAGMNKKQVDLLKRRAVAGAFRNMAVPPTAIMPPGSRDPGAPALVRVGSQPLK
jgi:hypothetical protein